MANPKRMKTWRRPSLSYTRSDTERGQMAIAYKQWLCRQHGWFTETEPCKHCHGEGKRLPNQGGMSYSRLRTWKKNRKAAGKPAYLVAEDKEKCDNCDGEGKVTLSAPVLDMNRADAHIGEQSYRLDMLAHKAVERIEIRLRARGFRPVISGMKPATLAEYDTLEAEHDALSREFTARQDAVRQAQATIEAEYAAMTSEEKCEALNSRDLFRHVRELEREVEQIRQKMWQYRVQHGFWYAPGARPERIVWAGTHAARHYYDAPKSMVQMVIRPGRSPGEAELDRLVDETIADEAELIAA